MKNNYFFKTFIALFITVNVMAQNVPNYVPKNGLVGWWPFNGNANDESGNGNHGTVDEATLESDRFSNVNSSYSFLNPNSKISLSTISSDSVSSISVSGWFKKSIAGIDGAIFAMSNGCNGADGLRLFIGNDNFLYWGVEKTSCVGVSIFSNLINYADNNWHFFVAIYNKTYPTYVTTDFSLWIDGVKVGIPNTNSIQGINSPISNNLFSTTIGNHNLSSNTFTGSLDDIAIYNRALTQEEITALYTSTPPCTNPSAVITPQGNTTFCQGGFVNLNASTGANYTYEWYNNGQLIKGATASIYQASASGNYTVKVIDGACDATSTVTTVMVNPNPTATITPQGNTTFCQGGFVNLVASGGTSYQWNTGLSVDTISATQSATYTVDVFNSFGCQAAASQQVIVNPLPNVTLNALNQFTLKNASPIQLVANPTGGTFSGDGVQGATFTSANVSLGKKTITYNYTSPLGCSGKASSNTFVVDSIGNVCNVTKYDTVKVTKTVYDTLKVTKTIYDTVKVTKIVYDTLKVTKTIYDTVKVTKTITDTVSILKVKFKLTTGIKANQYTSMNVYPNPTSDVIIIEASDVAALNGYSYKLFDVQGKEVYNALVTNTKTEISMKTFGKAGVYILHIVDANNVSIETKQIVLE